MAPPDRIGPYELVARLGRGGMGEVWSARHTTLGLAAAVKTIEATRRGDARLSAALADEILVVATLDHPHVVALYDQGEGWLAMELAAGSLDRQPPAAWTTVRAWLAGILEALAHAHARGVVHLDLKLPNVLIGADGAVRLADFGIAAVLDREGRPEARGSPVTMSPEQFDGRWRDFGPPTDLYALGCVACELVSGQPPFPDASLPVLAAAHRYTPPPRLAPSPLVPDGLDDWVLTLLQKDPRDRFSCAADALAALLDLGEPDEDGLVGGAASAGAFTTRSTSAWELASSAPIASAPAARPASVRSAALPPTWKGRTPDRDLASERLRTGLALFGLRAVPIVGRDAERDLLWAELAAVAGSGARVVTLQGDPGVGKSRLARWLAERAVECGARAVRIDAGEADPIAPALERALRTSGLPREARDARLRAALPPAEAELAARLLEGAAGFEGDADRHDALARVISAIGDGRPAVCWIDDAHESADLIAFARAAAGRPERLLVVLTAREAGSEALPGRTVRLDPLPPAHHARLVRELLHLSGDLAARVEARTAGNPLFAEQIVADWVTRGMLRPDAGGILQLVSDEPPLPAALGALWGERVAALPAEIVAPLERAAALGLAVDDAEWAAVWPGPTAAARGALASAGLLRPAPGGWTFVHGMLREALEAHAREHARHEAHHEACARALEGRGARPERVARHLIEAGHVDRALDLLLDSVWEAIDAAPLELLDLLARAERGMRRHDVPADDHRWGLVWARRAAACNALGRAEDARRWSLRALEGRDASWKRGRADAALVLANLTHRSGELDRSIELARGALADFAALGRHTDAAWCEVALAQAMHSRGAGEQALAHLGRAAEAFAAQRAERGMLGVLNVRGMVRYARGDLEGARADWERAHEIASRMRMRRRIASLRNNLGDVARKEGRLADAEAAYRASVAMHEELGAAGAAVGRLNLALVLADQGRPEEALAVATEARRELERRGRRLLVAGAGSVLLRCAAELGDWARWDVEMTALRDVIGELADADLAEALDRAAARASAAGQPERARAAGDLAVAQWRRLGQK